MKASPARPAKRAATQKARPSKVNEAIAFAGSMTTELMQIRTSELNLFNIFGKAQDGRDVLVPIIDWQLYGNKALEDPPLGDSEYGPKLTSYFLSFDNLAFLLQDMGSDVLQAASLLSKQSANEVRPIDDRMVFSARMLRLASQHMASAAEMVEQMLDPAEELA